MIFKIFAPFSQTSQGRIYVANEYPTFARTMLIVGQKLIVLRQITLNRVQNLPVFIKIMQILQIFG
mgnify:CR=1 FL=1